MKRRDCTGRLVTRSEESVADYSKRYVALRATAERETGRRCNAADVAAWLCRQDGRWAASSIRQYVAAIRQGAEAEAITDDVRALVEAHLSEKPAARVKGEKRTSAKKRKSLPQDEHTTLMAYLTKSSRSDDKLIAGYLMFNIALFLRPIEYRDAYIERVERDSGSGQSSVLLVVRNAKATNGRANGSVRKRDLSQCDPKYVRALELFLLRFQRALDTAGSWKALRDRLASRLARVCETHNIDRVSFYTLRHVGMATAKRSMTPVEVAAAAGHGSVHTAMSHYAKRRSGWHLSRAFAGKPTPDSIAAVRGQPKAFRPGAVKLGPRMP